jgi:hypothetical protein
MSFILVKDEPDQHLYRHDSFLLDIHWDELRLQHLISIANVCDQIIKDHGSLTSLILLRGAVNVDLSNEMRKASAALTAKCNPYNTGQAVVVEANGFMASLARSVITGINLLARAKTSQRVFQDTREATGWLVGLPSQPAGIQGEFDTLWPQIDKIMQQRSRASAGQARIATP